MKRLLSGGLVVALVCGSVRAQAQQPGPENPPPPPSSQYPPPPPSSPPPSYPPSQYPPQYPQQYPAQPGYYPPPVYVAPQSLPPPRGIGELVVGGIFFVSGIGLLAGGVVLYDDWAFYCTGTRSCGTTINPVLGTTSNGKDAEFGASIALLTIGSVMTVMGAIFTPVGVIKMARYSRWKREHHLANVNLQPIIAATPHAGELGFKITF
jgi:hypothetical protein